MATTEWAFLRELCYKSQLSLNKFLVSFASFFKSEQISEVQWKGLYYQKQTVILRSWYEPPDKISSLLYVLEQHAFGNKISTWCVDGLFDFDYNLCISNLHKS